MKVPGPATVPLRCSGVLEQSLALGPSLSFITMTHLEILEQVFCAVSLPLALSGSVIRWGGTDLERRHRGDMPVWVHGISLVCYLCVYPAHLATKQQDLRFLHISFLSTIYGLETSHRVQLMSKGRGLSSTFWRKESLWGSMKCIISPPVCLWLSLHPRCHSEGCLRLSLLQSSTGPPCMEGLYLPSYFFTHLTLWLDQRALRDTFHS
jgi:hypothetical protein